MEKKARRIFVSYLKIEQQYLFHNNKTERRKL